MRSPLEKGKGKCSHENQQKPLSLFSPTRTTESNRRPITHQPTHQHWHPRNKGIGNGSQRYREQQIHHMSLDCQCSNDTSTKNLGSFVVELMSPKRTTAYKTATTTHSTLKLLFRQTKPTHDPKAHYNSTPDDNNKTSNHTECSDQKAWTYATRKEGRQAGCCGKCATALWPQRYSLFLYTLDGVLLVLLGISSKRSKVDQQPRTVAKKKIGAGRSDNSSLLFCFPHLIIISIMNGIVIQLALSGGGGAHAPTGRPRGSGSTRQRTRAFMTRKVQRDACFCLQRK